MLLTDMSDACLVAAHQSLLDLSTVFREEYGRLPRSDELGLILSEALSAAGADFVSDGFGEFSVQISVKRPVAPRVLGRTHCLVVPLGAQNYSLLAAIEVPEQAVETRGFEPSFGIVTSFETSGTRTSFSGLPRPVQIPRRLLFEQLQSGRWWLVEVRGDRRVFCQPEQFSAPLAVDSRIFGATSRGRFGCAYDAHGRKRLLSETESESVFGGPLAPLYDLTRSPSSTEIEDILRRVAPLKGVPPRRWPPSSRQPSKKRNLKPRNSRAG